MDTITVCSLVGAGVGYAARGDVYGCVCVCEWAGGGRLLRMPAALPGPMFPAPLSVLCYVCGPACW